MPKNESLDTKRHSLAHLMAASIQELFPEARFGVGPVIEDGFYYDVALHRDIGHESPCPVDDRRTARGGTRRTTAGGAPQSPSAARLSASKPPLVE